MALSIRQRRPLGALLLGLSFLAIPCAVGCQSEIGGQLLPSAHYFDDDVQYFAPGTEFIAAQEATAMRAAAGQENP